jgi:hypothetical protein
VHSRRTEVQGMKIPSFAGRLTLAFVSIAVSGCGSQGSSPGVPAMLQQTQHSSAAKNGPLIYVANTHEKGGRWHHASLLGFASDANGNVPPVFDIRGNATDMGRWLGGSTSVAVDKRGRMYAIGINPCEIGVWPAGSNGDVRFASEFPVNCDDFGGPPISFVLDGRGDIWAASFVGTYMDGAGSKIYEYPPVPAGATGEITPGTVRSIGGPKTGLHYVTSIALNGKGQVSVQNSNGRNSARSNTILTFAETANGNVAPLSRLEGYKTQLSGKGYESATGIKYDSQGRLVACSNNHKPRLLTFARGAHGNVAPIRTLFVPGCSAITLDPQDNIYIAFEDSISVYAAGSVGSATPIRIIRGNLTTLSGASSIAF